jgi:hypothetical protein
MRPNGGACNGHKPLQWLTGGGVFFRESCDDGLTEDLHSSMFPFLGTAVKPICIMKIAWPPRSRVSGVCFSFHEILRAAVRIPTDEADQSPKSRPGFLQSDIVAASERARSSLAAVSA